MTSNNRTINDRIVGEGLAEDGLDRLIINNLYRCFVSMKLVSIPFMFVDNMFLKPSMPSLPFPSHILKGKLLALKLRFSIILLFPGEIMFHALYCSSDTSSCS